MTIIKECYPGRNDDDTFLYIIRTNTYINTLAHVRELAQKAFADFNTFERGIATLSDKNFEIVLYGGKFYAGTIGIEFIVRGHRHEDYVLIDQPEIRR